MRHAASQLFVLLLAAVSAFGQFDTATVLGTIHDASGGAIKGSRVTLQNLDTGITRTAETDDTGNYQFLTVRIGRYKVTAESSGFKSGVTDPFEVTVNARQRVDLNLQVGSTSESITVTDAVAVLETDNSARGTVIGTQQIVNLPLNGRSYADLALLAPGVRRSGISDSRDASFNVNGLRSSLNNFVIDGVDNNSYGTSNQGFSNQVVQLSPDAVQEFKLETANYSAEYGRAGGAVVNASIRSGTNQFHGAAWEYLRNTVLNATGFFKPVNNQKPNLIQNQFGGAIGGPIRRDKMFFFADYEGYRRISSRVTFATIPTLDQRNGILGVPVMNPYTGERFMDGIIPKAQMTKFASGVLGGLPAPTGPGTANNYQSQPRRTDQYDKGDIRYDHFFNQKLSGFARYSYRLMNNFEPPAIPGPSGGDANGTVRVQNQQFAGGFTYTISPTSLLEFRLGYSATEGGKSPIFVGTPTIGETYGIPNIPNDPRYTGGVSRQNVSGFTAMGVQSSNPQFQNPSVLDPKINFTKILGRHTIKSGWEYQDIHTDIDDFNPKYGDDSYAGRFSRIPGTPTSDLQYLADFIFGARSRYQLNNAVIMNYRQRMNFLYIQDDFKVNSRLTLNAGLRYEFATPQWEAQNRITNYDPVANQLVVAKDGDLFDRALVHPDKNNFAPRVGLAFTLTPKTVIRSAYGVSFINFNRMGGENLLAYNLPHVFAPFIDQLAPTVSGSGQPVCTSNLQNPQTCFRPMEQGFPTGFLNAATINVLRVRTNQIPFDLRTAYSQTWHFTIQQELPKNFLMEVAYVGTHAVKMMILGDLNQARPNLPTENLPIQARRPIQQFGYIQSAFNGGFLNYNGFQAKIERRFSNGLYLLNSFTWSKSIDNASGHLEAQNGDNSRVNMQDIASERGLSGYDQPFNNTTTLLYDLPFGKGRKYGSSWNRLTDSFLGGWGLNAINFYSSGVPVNLNYAPSSQFQVSDAPTMRPNIFGDPVVPEAQRTPANWLSKETVQIPVDPSRPFGNAGRNIVRAPALNQLNFGIHKNFRTTENQYLEFRAEAFNAFNHTNFNSPNATRSSGSYGTITSTQAAREIQFALRYVF